MLWLGGWGEALQPPVFAGGADVLAYRERDENLC